MDNGQRPAERENDDGVLMALGDAGWRIAGVKERTYVTGVWAGCTVVEVEMERRDGLRTMGAGQTQAEAIAGTARRIGEAS